MVGSIPLTSWSQLSQLCALPTSSPPPLLLVGESGKGAGAGKRESLDVVQVLFSNSQNMAVLSTLFQPQIQNSIWASVKDANSILARPRTDINHASCAGFVQEERLSGACMEVSY